MTSSPTLETLAEEASRSSRKNIAEPSPISTEVGSSPDAQTDRSVSGDEPSFQGRLQLDLEALEEGTASCNSASFVLLTVPRERTPNPGSLAQSVQGPLPTVLGRRDQSKNSSKSVAASYNVNPTSPHSVLTLPRSPNTVSWVPRWRREESRDEPGPGLAYLDTAAASRESDITLRKWSVGVRTLLQLQGGHGSYWLCFSALASMLLVEAAKTMPPEAIEIMKKIIAAAEKAPAEKPAGEAGKTRPAIKKLGNSDEADDMKRAVFMWDEATSKEALKEILKGKKLPEVVNGAMLVMEEVAWADPEDAKIWPKMLKKVAGMWFEEQVSADKPFVPPENAKEHCVYLMDAAQADAYLAKLGVKKVGKTGKQLMQDDERNAAFPDMDEGDKVYESFPDTAVLFMKDLVKKAA